MENLGLYLLVQLCLAFGVVGLLWPEKLMPIFQVLMFPWRASCGQIRAHGIAAIGAYLLLVMKLLYPAN